VAKSYKLSAESYQQTAVLSIHLQIKNLKSKITNQKSKSPSVSEEAFTLYKTKFIV
jgi:hypothetical protein